VLAGLSDLAFRAGDLIQVEAKRSIP